MELQEYLADRRGLIETALGDFIQSRYEDDLLQMAAHVAVGGKRLRGLMAVLCCEAVGGTPERALTAACAVELAHAASLVKDDVMDRDEKRRGGASFWKRFGFDLALLVPDVILPHAILFTQEYGPRALVAVVDAWGKIAQGQLLDFPRGRVGGAPSYQQIIALKTAPLFEVACELGVRAARMDWLISLGKQYGYHCGMAFQVYDDYTDLRRAVNQPWSASATGQLPVSLRSLQQLNGNSDLITEAACSAMLSMAEQYLQRAVSTVATFPDSEVKALLMELPQFCCDSLIAEARAPAGRER